jgi:hypothetical protein
MKRIAIFISLALFISIGSIFADDFGFSQFNTMGNNLFGYGSVTGNNIFNKSDLTLFASGDASKAENNKMTGFLLNFLLGFGIGSFVQGDTTGGTIGLVGDTVGTGMLIIYFVKIISATSQYDSDLLAAKTIAQIDSVTSTYNKNLESAFTFAIVGAVVYGGSRIFQLVRPFTYANKFSVAVVPTFDNNGQLAITAAVNFKY